MAVGVAVAVTMGFPLADTVAVFMAVAWRLDTAVPDLAYVAVAINALPTLVVVEPLVGLVELGALVVVVSLALVERLVVLGLVVLGLVGLALVDLALVVALVVVVALLVDWRLVVVALALVVVELVVVALVVVVASTPSAAPTAFTATAGLWRC